MIMPRFPLLKIKMSGLKRKTEKKEIKFDEWVKGGEHTIPEIRSDAGRVYSRYIKDKILIFDINLKKPVSQERVILEQKVVWSDGKEHILPRSIN